MKGKGHVSSERVYRPAGVDVPDPEEEILWNGSNAGHCLSAPSSHKGISACREVQRGAGQSSNQVSNLLQSRSEAMWIPSPSQSPASSHQYAVLRNFLEGKGNETSREHGACRGLKTSKKDGTHYRRVDPLHKDDTTKVGSGMNAKPIQDDSLSTSALPGPAKAKGLGHETQMHSYVEKNPVQSGNIDQSLNEAVNGLTLLNLQQSKSSRGGCAHAKSQGIQSKDALLLWIACEGVDEGEVTISKPFPSSQDGLQAVDVGQTKVSSISVSNNGKNLVNLGSVKLLFMRPKDSFTLTLDSNGGTDIPSVASRPCLASSLGPYSLLPGSSLSFQLAFTPRGVGYHKAVLLFDLGRQKVLRYANLMVEDDIARRLAPSEPYCRRVASKNFRARGKVICGKPPPAPTFRKPVKQYPIPRGIERALTKNHTLPVFLLGLSFESYQEYFSSLVFAEELQWKVDIRAYDLTSVTMQFDKSGYILLRVPGLLERRPSLIYRDSILVKPVGSKKMYKGYVCSVRAQEVLLNFHPSFHKSFIANVQYDVRFSYSRITIRRALQAIDASKHLDINLLFPSHVPPSTTGSHINAFQPINRLLNKEQRQSVLEILRKAGGPPYLIYGPPGTGKTVTIVEAILQALKLNANGRILACAPSNAAADVLLHRLRSHLQVMDLLRLNAFTRPLDDLAPELWPYCYSDGSFFCCPPLQKLLKFKVVVSTYCSAAILEAQGLQRGNFSHIFLDESGQAMEPEALIPVANFVSPDTVLVLAGDHKQLGPIIRSSVAQKFGLGISLLERLSASPLYTRSQAREGALAFNEKVVTKLVRNYRSHPAILDLPSRLFYDGELIANAPAEICNSMCDWEELLNKSFPLLFVGIEGRDEREGRSPSWFNAQEASKVIEIVGKLKECRRNRISDDDIGIISPYNQQVKKIKAALASKSLLGIKTGSVEEFQGQERRIIIISTVRSSQEFVELDQQYRIGFLDNPKRFNVAITRAKALLVVIGNPYVLAKDRHWGELLQYCISNKSYVGCTPPTENVVGMEEFNKIMDGLVETRKQNADTVEDDAAAFESPWPNPT